MRSMAWNELTLCTNTHSKSITKIQQHPWTLFWCFRTHHWITELVYSSVRNRWGRWGEGGSNYRFLGKNSLVHLIIIREWPKNDPHPFLEILKIFRLVHFIRLPLPFPPLPSPAIPYNKAQKTWEYSFSTYAKRYSSTFLISWHAHVSERMRVTNIRFSENFAYALNGPFLTQRLV